MGLILKKLPDQHDNLTVPSRALDATALGLEFGDVSILLRTSFLLWG